MQGGRGGLAGINTPGTLRMVDIMAMYSTIFGISLDLVARNGSTSCPIAAPKGLAREARAVAETRPREVNHSSLLMSTLADDIA